MKRNVKIFLLFTICSIFTSYGQSDIKITESKNSSLIKVLNNSALLVENSEDYLSVRIYIVDNGSGSAGSASCEVSHNLLIAVSEFDENPKQNLFKIGPIYPMYNPEFLNWVKGKNKKEVTIEYGSLDERKGLKMIITIDELLIENITL